MTAKEFQALPFLLFEHQVVEVSGYARNTVRKLVDCGVLVLVKPEGCGQGRFQKRQVAQLLGLEGALDTEAFKREPMLMAEKGVTVVTGYSPATLARMVGAGSLEFVQPAGLGAGRYRKGQVARLIGFEELV